MLKIVVCVKAVPDPQKASEIRIDPDTKNLARSDIPLVLNPLDKNALEEALRIKEREKAHLSVISMGPPAAGQIIKECLALGADRGFLLTDIAFAGADAYSTAFTLARGIKAIGEFDLILCGMASSDGSTEWVGPEMASFLDVPVVTMINEIVESGNRWWKVKAALENGYRLVEVQLPALFTVTRELNDPRTLSFSGIIKSRKKEITEWGREDVGLSESEVGLKGSPTIVSEMTTIESGRKVELLTGTSEEKADLLVEKLVEAGVL